MLSQLGLDCGCSLTGFLARCSAGGYEGGAPTIPLNAHQTRTAPLYDLGSLVPIHVDDGSSSGSGQVLLQDVYELDKKALGRGSYGEVWGATHRQTGARRAVKSVDKLIVAKARGDFLRRELDILRQLDHPNVLRLYEAFEDANAIYLVLELCEGGDLLERVATTNAQMPEREAAKLLVQMLGAIQHLHMHGVVHRDVKPENFLFTRREFDREPLPPEVAPMKLIDFGLSRRLSKESGMVMTPKIGTTEYMAPEAFMNQVSEKQADRVDMWSVGVVLHTMLTGHFPSPRLAKEPPDEYLATPYWNRFSENARNLLSRLLHFQPERRLSTTQALRHAWLKAAVDVGDVELVSGIPDAIRSYASYPGLRRLVLVAAAREVDDRDIYSVRMLYQKLSLECDGVLNRSSLECVSCMTGPLGAAAAELLQAFGTVDTDGSGTIDWTELVAAALCTPGALARRATASDGDSNFEGAAGAADAEATGEDACFRAFDLLRHGNGAVSCEAPSALSHGGAMSGQPKTSRQWYLM